MHMYVELPTACGFKVQIRGVSYEVTRIVTYACNSSICHSYVLGEVQSQILAASTLYSMRSFLFSRLVL